MGCCFKCHGKVWNLYKNQEDEENKKFETMKRDLKNSLNEINETINMITNFDSLLNPEEDSDEENDLDDKSQLIELMKSMKKEQNICSYHCFICSKNCVHSKKCLFFLFICGWLFCLIQLIGVQSGIIILNALFSEIVEEFKFLAEIPREYNFYEYIEIASYKSLPEIDVGMFFNFLGLITLKKCEFKYTCFIFQLTSIIIMALLFLLFDFHTGGELLFYYTRIELTVLFISYILLSISVGASSMIALKEFFNLYHDFYENNFDISKIFCCVEKYFQYMRSKRKEKESIESIGQNKIQIDEIEDKNEEEKNKKKEEKEKKKKKTKIWRFFYYIYFLYYLLLQ